MFNILMMMCYVQRSAMIAWRFSKKTQLNGWNDGFQMKCIQFPIKTCNNDLEFTVTLFIYRCFEHSARWIAVWAVFFFLNGCVSACHSFQNVEWDFAVLRIGFDLWCKRNETVFEKRENQGPGEVASYYLRINSVIYLISNAQIFLRQLFLCLFFFLCCAFLSVFLFFFYHYASISYDNNNVKQKQLNTIFAVSVIWIEELYVLGVWIFPLCIGIWIKSDFQQNSENWRNEQR